MSNIFFNLFSLICIIIASVAIFFCFKKLAPLRSIKVNIAYGVILNDRRITENISTLESYIDYLSTIRENDKINKTKLAKIVEQIQYQIDAINNRYNMNEILSYNFKQIRILVYTKCFKCADDLNIYELLKTRKIMNRYLQFTSKMVSLFADLHNAVYYMNNVSEDEYARYKHETINNIIDDIYRLYLEIQWKGNMIL